MADDIDDLLNEVEAKYVNGKTTKRATQKAGSSISNKTKLTEAIDDIFDDGVELKPSSSNSSSKTTVSGAARLMKCFPLLLGGSNAEPGHSSQVQNKCCNNLRCTDCDFSLVAFDNFEWKPQTDYLFLRNNMPDFHRLKSNLKTKRGSKAYACQCKSTSVSKYTDVPPDYKWVCGKH